MENSKDFQSYALTIGLGGDNEPNCVILTCDSIPGCEEIGLTASSATIIGGDLAIEGAAGKLRLLAVDSKVIEAFALSLPLVVIDVQSGREHLVEQKGGDAL